MKRIIEGKMYNTDTARAIASDSESYPSDFNYCCETLYLKRTGEYFLDGEGGPMSKYARGNGDGSCGFGDAITPLSKAQAKKWMEQHASADKYIEIFGEVAE